MSEFIVAFNRVLEQALTFNNSISMSVLGGLAAASFVVLLIMGLALSLVVIIGEFVELLYVKKKEEGEG